MITGTKEWAPEKDNCILGCMNDCRYCYAKMMAIRFKRATKESWKNERPNPNARAVKHEGRVMFPTSHDLHYDHLDLWNVHLHRLLVLGNDLLIISKPEFQSIRCIVEMYKTTPFKDQIEFRFTIGTNDEEIRKFWEPGAPPIEERLTCLEYAFKNGFRTSVSMEPLLMENPVNFISTFEKWVTGEIWIGLMNYLHSNDFTPQEMYWYHEQKRINSRENILKVWQATKDNPKVRYKDSIRDLLGLEGW